MLLPIEKEELLPKYFSRTSAIAFHNILTKTWYAPSGLERFIAPFQDVIGTFDDLIGYNTFLPLQLRTATPDQATLIVSHHRHGIVEGIMAPLGMNGPNGGRFKVLPAVCPVCIEIDIASCGTPFWNRANLVPGLMFCSLHHCPLEVGCEECAVQRDHNLLHRPGQHCGCGLKPLPGVPNFSTAQQEHEMELHRVSKLLLDPEYMPEFSRDAIARAARLQCRVIGLPEPGANREEEIERFFLAHPMKSLLERVGVTSSLRKIKSPSSNARLIYPNPLQTSALLMSLFASWSDVETAVKAASTGETLQQTEVAKEPALQSKMNFYTKRFREKRRGAHKDEYTKRYIAIRKSHPDITHGSIMKRVGYDSHHVLKRAELIAAGVDVPAFRYDPKKCAEVDLKVSNHVVNTAVRLLSENTPARLTEALLLEGSIYREHQHMKAQLLRTRAALDSYLETAAEWRSRTRGSTESIQKRPRKRETVAISLRRSGVPFIEIVTHTDAARDASELE